MRSDRRMDEYERDARKNRMVVLMYNAVLVLCSLLVVIIVVGGIHALVSATGKHVCFVCRGESQLVNVVACDDGKNMCICHRCASSMRRALELVDSENK